MHDSDVYRWMLKKEYLLRVREWEQTSDARRDESHLMLRILRNVKLAFLALIGPDLRFNVGPLLGIRPRSSSSKYISSLWSGSSAEDRSHHCLKVA